MTGGPQASVGAWQGGSTNGFAANSFDEGTCYNISGGAHAGVRNEWFEAGSGQTAGTFANVIDASTFSYANSHIGVPNTMTLATINNFHGVAALVNIDTEDGNVNITGDGTGAKVLGLGLEGPNTTFFSNTSSPAATTEFLNGQTYAAAGGTQIAEQGCCDTTFLNTTLSELRTNQPTVPGPLPSGVTNVQFYRVFAESANYGIHLINH